MSDQEVTRIRDLGDAGNLCAWELVRGLCRAMMATSYDGAGRCWCRTKPTEGFHTQACCMAQAELSAARLTLGDTRRPLATSQADEVTD